MPSEAGRSQPGNSEGRKLVFLCGWDRDCGGALLLEPEGHAGAGAGWGGCPEVRCRCSGQPWVFSGRADQRDLSYTCFFLVHVKNPIPTVLEERKWLEVTDGKGHSG